MTCSSTKTISGEAWPLFDDSSGMCRYKVTTASPERAAEVAADAEDMPGYEGRTDFRSVRGQVRFYVDFLATETAGATRSAGPALLERLAGVRNLPSGRLRVMCVHGVGDQRSGTWKHSWLNAMNTAVAQWNSSVIVEPLWVEYDDLVQKHGVGGGDYAEALLRLGWSGLRHGISDFFGDIFGRRRRGIADIPESVRWTAGMVAQWAAQEQFRRDTRQRLLDRYAQESADDGIDAIFAHSLGSLVAYDTMLHNKALLGDGVFVSFGSQIGNPFVRGAFGGYLHPLKVPARWYHLFNPADRVLTADVPVRAVNFKQVLARFDSRGFLNHDADEYLKHENAIAGPWEPRHMPPGRRLAGDPLAEPDGSNGAPR